ncbi:MAG: ATP-binding cassette domain-containing protein [Rhizobiales bacterium]|nr:ATP-binding cassette domain-containing protein [Hyphomicrobiales bacterium]
MAEASRKVLSGDRAGPAAIAVDGLSYTYPGQSKPAVDHVSFDVRPGEIFGLLGPSGAGKTTTQRVLTRQQRHFVGDVRVLGRPLTGWGREFFEEIGVGFELPNHYLKFTAVENLRFFASLYRKRSRDPIELLHLVGLEAAANKKVDAFSKGMRMRLNFVRAFQHDPKLLFLDEPTAGLDPVNAGIVKSIIKALRGEGKTIVLTTHNMTDVDELCDRVSFMVDGKFAALDVPDALKAKFGRRVVTVEYVNGNDIFSEEFGLDSLGTNDHFLHVIRSYQIRKIHSQEATLDQVFSDVTGVRLGDAE